MYSSTNVFFWGGETFQGQFRTVSMTSIMTKFKSESFVMSSAGMEINLSDQPNAASWDSWAKSYVEYYTTLLLWIQPDIKSASIFSTPLYPLLCQ